VDTCELDFGRVEGFAAELCGQTFVEGEG